MENENLKPIEKLTPFTKMIMTIGTLPSSFYASMTYYEQMVWLYEYLKNQVIPTVNNNGEAVEELQDAFIELKEWTETYTEETIPEEINNKLDEMATDGTLQAILDEIMKYKGLQTFNNVNDMKNSTNLVDGSFAKTFGYYSINDGGNAYYKIREKTTEDIIDNGSIIEINENLIAELNEIAINPKQFGCYGNGITDDSINFQKCITYGLNNNKSIIVDKSTYLINQTLNINNSNINIQCYGILKTSNEIPIINISGEYHNIYINEMQSNERKGIAIHSNGQLKFCNITINIINDFNKGISFDTSSNSTGGIYYNYIKNLHVTANSCIYLNGNNSFINQNYFYMGALNGLTGIVSEEITELTGEYNGNCFFNCGFENLTKAIDINNMVNNTFKDFRIFETISGSKIISLNNCYKNLFQSNITSALLQNDKIEDNTLTRRKANVFECYLTLYGSETSQHCIKALSYNNLFEIIENIDIPSRYSFGNQEIYTSNLPSLSLFNEFSAYNSEKATILHLDERYNYNNEYTQNLVLYISFIGGQYDLKIYDANNTLIFDLINDYVSHGILTPGGTALFKFTLYNGKLYPYLIKQTSS